MITRSVFCLLVEVIMRCSVLGLKSTCCKQNDGKFLVSHCTTSLFDEFNRFTSNNLEFCRSVPFFLMKRPNRKISFSYAYLAFFYYDLKTLKMFQLICLQRFKLANKIILKTLKPRNQPNHKYSYYYFFGRRCIRREDGN